VAHLTRLQKSSISELGFVVSEMLCGIRINVYFRPSLIASQEMQRHQQCCVRKKPLLDVISSEARNLALIMNWND